MELEIKNRIDEDIDPSEIIMDDDSDMPQPETKQYELTLKPTLKFMNLFNESVAHLPYATTLTNTLNNSIKLIDLVKFVETKFSVGMTVNEMNTILSFISKADFACVRPLMEAVEDKQRQSELWTLNN